MKGIQVFDDVVADPMGYRAQALAQEFADVTLGEDTFKGIAFCPDASLVAALVERLPGLKPTLTFFRKSPEGQREPNYIHSDEMMGNWTGIYYMNPEPPEGDGTTFWEQDGDAWVKAEQVPARFNRLLVFRAGLHHSRSLFDNYGHGNDARLIQVVFAQ